MAALEFSYRPRSYQFLELWTPGDWRIKVYGIAYEGDRPDSEVVEAAKRLAVPRLEEASANHYGVGFLAIHAGKTGNFVFVDWWCDENELHHHVWMTPLGDPFEFEYLTPRGIAACVWDLHLIAHEQQAWIETALKPETADLDAYLARRLNGMF
ncbi:hypothetical protein Mal4_26510 [Maioricimonas rarisocia]|uniref:Isochorismatase n=1 Tax=Maioricimonas rarisocia TaxID=2528026 RepID=A0A517Z796_9PLAN|nr:isochorismatase [Maioricimonas rarisocia]QDU38324.1 hypothetical protein Mal4_26510 [Maioricimonas rarisocia]